MQPNPRATAGNNSLSLEQAKARLETSGFMLARLETLAMAVRDDRIDRGCLKVLVELIDTMNRETWTSWIGRQAIADRIGLSVKSAGNYIYQLKALGYIVGEKRETPQAENRVLMHYTLSALSPEELEAAITRAVGSIRGDVDTVTVLKSARHSGQFNGKVPPIAGNKVPVPTGSACDSGQSKQEVPVIAGTIGTEKPKSARHSGRSNINNNTNLNTRASGERGVGREEKPKKATRLDPKWNIRQTPDWGRWATDHFSVRPSAVDAEGEKFHDYWIAQPGSKALKVDWFATWRNWARRAFAGKEKKTFNDSDNLFEIEPESENDRQLALAREKLRQGRIEDGLA